MPCNAFGCRPCPVDGWQALTGAVRRSQAPCWLAGEATGALAGWKAKAGLLWLGWLGFAFGRAVLIDVSPKATKAGHVIEPNGTTALRLSLAYHYTYSLYLDFS